MLSPARFTAHFLHTSLALQNLSRTRLSRAQVLVVFLISSVSSSSRIVFRYAPPIAGSIRSASFSAHSHDRSNPL
jgi:hypothetical protein